ncbi:MAG TPA: aminotransferase class I/II-fold pyridoxal phosphate-dependent enzyme [Bryobacteraceae bacterium]|nr:aminotransferase class I/II-fold pyridoxal phosphate-dependent enzyme [Bryobacteraceae bacterium]
MRIPQWPISDQRERQLVDEVLSSPQWGGYHEFVTRFERQFAEFQHCRHGVSAVNGSVTLEMLLAGCGVKPGDEVIVPAISFVSTATAVTRIGAIPVFVDIEPYSFNIDPERIAAAITAKTKAIIPVHFGGPLADMDRIPEIAGEHDLVVLEDAAHAHGSGWKGRRAGSLGRASSFSFQNGKVMTSGEGGIMLTDDEALAADLRSFANCGRRPGATFFHHYVAGTNFRLSGLHAAVLLAQLERLPGQVARRAANAAVLLRELEEVEGIRWQQIDPRVTANSWYLLLGRIDEKRFGMSRDEFHRMLTEAGIPCTPFYPHTLYQNPLYQHSPCRVEPCPNAEAAVRDAFWIPHTVLLGGEDLMHEVADVIRRAIVRR